MTQHKHYLHIRTSLYVFVILVISSGIMLGLSSGGFIISFKTIGFSVLSSMQKSVKAVSSGITGTISAVKELRVLRQEHELLKQQLQNYEYLQQSNAEIKKENERLREQLNFVEQFNYKSFPAQIIGRDPNSQYSLLTIGKGSKHGIRKNMPVIAVQNGQVGLVGKVLNVGFTTSMVMPIYAYDCNISARIQNTRDIGLVNGLGDSNEPLVMKYIKKQVLTELQYGDLVVTSGENDNYLKDIPIGYISLITVQDYDSSLNIELVPVIDFHRLETLIVVDMKDISAGESN